MNQEKIIKWIKAAGIRALKTFCQTAASMYIVGQAMLEVEWKHIFSIAGAACIFSLFTSFAGLPELDDESEQESEQGDESEC